jgi:NAD(P)-dependent dehydrogenase (short-subunit alcohol dehydrogenase family)
MAAIEEGDDAEVRAMFETNFFGAVATIKAVLPQMRARRSGYIINISSQAGLMSNPGTAYYSASKHALEGLTEGLVREVKPLGIRITAVEPGPFRTEWAGPSLKQDRSAIADYQETAQARMVQMSGYSGQQPGDPARAAQAMIDVTLNPNPPRHLVLGKFGFEAATSKLKARLAEIEAQKDIALAADFPT